MNTINRPQYLDKLIRRSGNGMIKIITGIRRCGKSFLLFNIFYDYLRQKGVPDSHIIRIALDDPENGRFLDPDELYKYLSEKIKDASEKYYVLLDEVQLAISREELKNKDGYVRLYGVLNGLLHKRNVDVYVTGSNSKLLSKDVLTEFRGRGDEIHLAPLSFSEFFSVQNKSKYDAWNDYLLYGGMPYLMSLNDDSDRIDYLNSLNREIYLKDISERYGISNLSGMEELQKVIASSIGSLTNPQKISNTFVSSGIKGISAPTIKEYLNYLQESFVVEKAERFNVKGRKYISTPSKYYYSDLGLRNALLGFRQFEETHLMENAIYNELKYRGYSVDVGVVEINVSENGKHIRRQLEVDFVANKGSARYYIQSAYAVPDKERMDQEQASLVNIPDSFKKIIVVNSGGRLWHNEQGVTIMNIFDFLLDENCLDR